MTSVASCQAGVGAIGNSWCHEKFVNLLFMPISSDGNFHFL